MSGFMGKDGFVWFVNVVEDRQDPQKLMSASTLSRSSHGRQCKTTYDPIYPKLHPMNPITSATVQKNRHH